MTRSTLLTLIGAATTTLISTAAPAQSNVTVYGVLDQYLGRTTAKGGDSKTSLDSGGLMASRLGFRGTEDLGGGLKANFLIEHGFSADTGAAADTARSFNRASWLGLSGNFGELRLGRQNTPQFFMLGSMDAFGGATYGSLLNNVSGYTPRFDNTIHYIAPEFSGVKLQAGLSLGEQASSSRALNAYLLGAEYRQSNLYVGLNHAQQNSADASVKAKATFLGGNYDYGSGKVYVGLFAGDTPGANMGANTKGRDTRAWSISADYRFGPALTVGALLGASKDRATDKDASQASLIATYAASRRTLFYAVATRLNNKGSANYSLGAAGPITRNTPAAGGDTSGVQVGVRHSF